MARIYISYQHTDAEFVKQISFELRKRGHEMLVDETVLNVGQDWRKILLDSLRNADGVLVLISERSLHSHYVVSEVGAARAYVSESANQKFLIPVILGKIPIPSFIEDLQCIRIDNDNFYDSVDKIDASISMFLGKKEAVKENRTQERQQIERKAADYIKDATTALKKREWHNRIVAYLAYMLGLVALAYGVVVGISGLNSINEVQTSLDQHQNQVWGIYIFAVLKSIIIIGLLVACSKYSFMLGKSFMHEALRNADRIHAISFGEFFLKAYGDKINSHAEIRDVFRDWNIDNHSSMGNLDASSYDPKFGDNLVEIVKTLSNKIKTSD